MFVKELQEKGGYEGSWKRHCFVINGLNIVGMDLTCLPTCFCPTSSFYNKQNMQIGSNSWNLKAIPIVFGELFMVLNHMVWLSDFMNLIQLPYFTCCKISLAQKF